MLEVVFDLNIDLYPQELIPPSTLQLLPLLTC